MAEQEDEIIVIPARQQRSRFPILNKLSDFANVFKAFIGCNYLSMSFAFKQSGMILGIIGLIFIAYITDHCCLLIVKCKHAAIKQIMNATTYPIYADTESGEFKELEKAKKKKRHYLEMSMTYGDIGHLTMGKWGTYIVNTALIITQFSFCINYFIFMGDTITRMYPPAKQNETHTNSSNVPMLEKSSSKKEVHEGAPNVIYLMLLPFPLFLLQSLVRKLRSLGPLSAIANFCVFLGFFSILGFIINGLDLQNIYHISLWRFSTFPIFFGQVIGAYEGIGTIIPIEASMNENRPNFPRYLHGAIILVSIILGTFGIFGYLHFMDGIEQLISDNLPYGTLSIIVRITLCVGILFTYPLQIFPVVEIFENIIFKETKARNAITSSFQAGYSNLVTGLAVNAEAADRNSGEGDSVDDDDSSGDSEVDIPHEMPPISEESHVHAHRSRWHCDIFHWSTWKKNIFRTFLVTLSLGVAYVCRNYYAYVTAISGSIGSSLLAFVLPCAFHFILKKDEISTFIITKDILLILFGIIAGLVGFVTTLIKIIEM